MLKVGITGGIGSGKSVVCRVFATLGIPVFNADDASRYLLDSDVSLQASVKALLGNDTFTNGKLDRARIASIVFNDPSKLTALNELIHPATIRYGEEWMAGQNAPYAIKEAAIFFESGSYKAMDVMVGISAPLELRITRAMQRTGSSRQQMLDRIARQMDEDEKMKRCEYVIVNDGEQAIIPQVLQLHQALLGKAALIS